MAIKTEPGLAVWADEAQLTQVLVNLINNGFQAMPKGGVVLVRARGGHEVVKLEVIDSGVGVAPENLERMFDPFFTTRAEGHGIGLALVEQLVRAHGGDIAVTSTLGSGTTVSLAWPSKGPG